MRRLTTPTHRFRLKNIDLKMVDKIKITYSQGDKVVLEKYKNDVALEGDSVVIKLTQEETAKFSTDKSVEIQIRVLTFGKDAPASKIITTGVKRVLDDEVLQ